MPQKTSPQSRENSTVSREAAFDALRRLLASQAFANASRLRELLSFVVQRTLDADSGRLKEQEVGAAVYGRDLSYDPHTDPVVRVAARQLRFKLADYYAGEGQADPVRISLPKGGYAAAFSATETVATAAGPVEGKRRRPHAIANLIAIALVIATAAWMIAFRKPGRQIRSIAVLPFQNLSGDPAKDYISDGLTEELTSAMVRIPNLRVVARTSAYQFKGKGEDVRTIGQKLNVDAVLEGSVLEAGSRLRITAQLNRTSDGYHVWAERYDRDVRESISLQDEIARAVSAHVEGGVPPAKALVQHTESVEAHNNYLMGRFLFNQRSEESVRKGIQFLDRAIAADPAYADAYASLASSWMVLMGNDYERSANAAPHVRECAERAIQLDPSLGEPHAALGLLKFQYDWNWPAAEHELRHAIELAPGEELCRHFYASALLWMGKFSEALAELHRAVELDPLSAAARGGLIFYYAYARQPDRAIEESHRVLDAFPNFFLAHASLGVAYEEKHLYRQAIAEYERELALSPGDPDALRRCAHAYAVVGERARAMHLMDEMLHPAPTRYVPPVDCAAVYSGLGDKPHALACLMRGLDERTPDMTELRVEPALDNLRGDPDFGNIMRRVGLWNTAR